MKQLALLLLLIQVTRGRPCDGSGGSAALKLAIRDLLEKWEDTYVSPSPQSNQTYQSLPRSCKQIKATHIRAVGECRGDIP
ncbi:interleukin-36 receptor antagonist protein-like [Platysternon megacephalum]|uniref:Interleukin-36 receptor antagonist protein-like n=1 Tax=Platysternon megacephalum TaxID=55544 RepID=A0A4D9DLB0_9SAUR|nr:interleukin-36 receptor antagonist protein-like [Platysternon megacephalum]